MAASRRQSNGRSPLVNQQRQITSFFTKTNSASPSPSASLAKQTSKLIPNPNPKRGPMKSPSPSPITPSPIQSKLKKPHLVIGKTPSVAPSKPVDKSYGEDVVEKRIKVYWPLDKAWYEGAVKSFDRQSGKHLVQYDDAEEQELDLGKEKIEWVKESESTRKLKGLRRAGSSSGFKKVVIDDEDEDVAENANEKSDDDDSSDEDWGKNVDKEPSEDVDDEDMDLEDEKEEEEFEEDEEDEEIKMSKRKGGQKTELKKRKASGGGKLESGKKCKTSANASSKEELKVSSVKPIKEVESE